MTNGVKKNEVKKELIINMCTTFSIALFFISALCFLFSCGFTALGSMNFLWFFLSGVLAVLLGAGLFGFAATVDKWNVFEDVVETIENIAE